MILRKRIFLRAAILLFALICLIAAVLIGFTVHQQRVLGKEVYLSIGQTLAGEIDRHILWDDRVAVRQALEREMKSHKLFEYAFVERAGHPYVDVFSGTVPVALLRPETAKPEQKFVWEFRGSDGAVYYDLVVPVGKTGAVLRIGMKRLNMDRHTFPAIRAILIVCAGALLFGLAIAFHIARRATGEIALLCNAIRSYGDLGAKRRADDDQQTKDDVFELAQSFHSLVARRQQAELELSHSEENLSITLNSIGDAVIAVDVEERVTRMNPVAESLTGWTQAEALGRSLNEVFNIIQAQTRKKAKNPVDRVLHEGKIVGLANHTVLIARDGVEYQIADSAAPIWNAVDEIVGVVLVFRDVTDDYVKDQALRDSEDRLRSVFRVAPIGIGVVVDRVLKEINEQILAMTGYAREELMGQSSRILYPSDEEYETVGHEKYEQIQDHGTGTVETRWKCKDGRVIDVLLRSTPMDLDDWSKGVTFTALDISERKQMEVSLAAEQQLLSSLIETSPDSIYFKDRQSRFLRINAAHAKKHGLKNPVEAIGKTDFDFFDEDHARQAREDERRVMASGEPVIAKDEKVTLPDGRVFWASATKAPLRDAEGRIIGTFGITRDTTERKQTEEREKKMEAQLREGQRLASVGTLAGGIAHDFNNVLQTITGFCELILLDVDSPAVQQQNVVEIQKAAQHAAELTRQLLTFSRKEQADYKVVDVNSILSAGENMLLKALHDDVRLQFEPEECVAPVEADSSQILQIAMNLIVNARDAMPDGGVITLSTMNRTVTEEELSNIPNSRAGRFVCFSVSDTGCGMNKKQLAHLFDPFYTTKPLGKGTGLGLSVVYGIVEKHEGWISVSSTLGHGSVFEVFLPVFDELAPKKTADQKKAFPGKQILLVEDDPMICELAAKILKGAGYDVSAVGDAVAARQRFDEKNGLFDLLFIDVELPDGNGLDLTEELLKQKPGIPVLIFSGSKESSLESRITENGYGFIPKPFSLRKLLDRVEAAVSAS